VVLQFCLIEETTFGIGVLCNAQHCGQYNCFIIQFLNPVRIFFYLYEGDA
jgi:hypothetical protein